MAGNAIVVYRPHRTGPRRRIDVDPDTSSQAQPQGGADTPKRIQERTPHERDESARATGNRMDEAVPPSGRVVRDAEKDVEQGRLDTDRRGIPNDVPSTGRRPGK